MSKKAMSSNRIEAIVSQEQYKILTLDGKVDSLEILNTIHPYKMQYQRWDIFINKSIFEKAMYYCAKQQSEKFKLMYMELKKYDPEYFEIAKKVLTKIKAEYNFE